MRRARARVSGILLLATSVTLSAGAQLLMKVGMQDLPDIDLYRISQDALGGILIVLPALAWVFWGLVCYGVSMLCWIAALARYELSFAYPMLGLSYVLVYVSAVFWPRLGESASPLKTMGIALVVVGVALVTRSASPHNPLNTPSSPPNC